MLLLCASRQLLFLLHVQHFPLKYMDQNIFLDSLVSIYNQCWPENNKIVIGVFSYSLEQPFFKIKSVHVYMFYLNALIHYSKTTRITRQNRYAWNQFDSIIGSYWHVFRVSQYFAKHLTFNLFQKWIPKKQVCL